MFDQPYFISPHAIRRFKERIADLPSTQIIVILQAALQNPDHIVGLQTWDKKAWPVYKCRYRNIDYFVLVHKNPGYEWPFVRTILLSEMDIGNLKKWRGGKWHWK